MKSFKRALQQLAITPHAVKIREVILLLLLGIYVLAGTVSTAMLIYRYLKHHDMFMAKRSAVLITCQATAGLLAGVICLAASAPQSYPCAAKLWAVYIGVLPWIGALVVRSVQRLVLYRSASDSSSCCKSVSTKPLTAIRRPGTGNRFDDGVRRPDTGMTVDVWSEFECPSRNSVSSLPHNHEACNAMLHHSRYNRFVTDKVLGLYLCAFGCVLVAYAMVANVKSGRFSVNASVCDRAGWELWPAYAIAIVLVGGVLPVLAVGLWRIDDPYGARNDLLVCIGTAVLGSIVYVLWQTVFQRFRTRLPELFFIWLWMMITHVSSVIWPLVSAKEYHEKMKNRPSSKGITNNYNGARVRRSVYTALYREFYMVLEDSDQRIRFLTFSARYYCSALTSFLDDYQALKFQTIDAIRHARAGYLPHRPASNHQLRDMEPPKAPAAKIAVSTEKVTGDALPSNAKFEKSLLLAPASVLLLPESRGGSGGVNGSLHGPCQTPVTVGIFDSAMLLLPPGTVDKTSQFPEAVKIAFSSLVSRYFSKSSHMAINVPKDIVDDVHMALQKNNVQLSILDKAKDEVLFLLCTDVYASYRKRPDFNGSLASLVRLVN